MIRKSPNVLLLIVVVVILWLWSKVCTMHEQERHKSEPFQVAQNIVVQVEVEVVFVVQETTLQNIVKDESEPVAQAKQEYSDG